MKSMKQSLGAIFLIVWLASSHKVQAADNNLLAYRLFEQGDYARAAEIFSDPAWKGLALYHSSQWWRAAEAFIRANDPVSAYNLGNCYVQLGYYALALEAYQHALSLDPSLDDAAHNADIMRALLTTTDEEQQRAGRRASGDEIDRIDSENPDKGGSQGDGGEEQDKQGDNAPGKSTDDGEQNVGPDGQAQAGKGGEASENSQQPDKPDGEGSGAIDGQPAQEDQENGRPSGGSETDAPNALAAAAGTRTALETEQATTQWLNRIEHDSQLFLQRRLKLERKRRRASGQSPPQGGSTW